MSWGEVATPIRSGHYLMMIPSRTKPSPNAYDRKAVQYRNRAEELSILADDGNHPSTSRQLHKLSDGYCKMAHQMDELSVIDRRLRRH